MKFIRKRLLRINDFQGFILLMTLVTISFIGFTQKKSLLKININTDLQTFNMEEFDNRINDPKYIDTILYDELVPISLSEGFNFGMSVTYQPFRFINLGIYGGVQLGDVSREIRIIKHLYDPWTPNDTIFGKRHFEVRSLHVGITSDLILNQMDSWQKNPSLKKLELAWNFRIGYGSSYLYYYDRFETEVNSDAKSVYSSNGIQLVSGVKLGYIIMNNDYFSSVGVKVGYQYYKTSDTYYPYNERTVLDFSGFTIGAYLSIGR